MAILLDDNYLENVNGGYKVEAKTDSKLNVTVWNIVDDSTGQFICRLSINDGETQQMFMDRIKRKCDELGVSFKTITKAEALELQENII